MASSAAASSSAVRNITQEYLQHAQLAAQSRRSAEDLKIEADKKLEDENRQLELIRQENNYNIKKRSKKNMKESLQQKKKQKK